MSWLPVRAALNRLTHAPDHFLVQQHLDQPPTTPLIILRHSKAMDRKDWSKKDTARPVNARGRRQSRLLVPMLGAYGITRLLSSTSARCIGTLQPYADARQLTIDKFSQLTEEVGGDDPRAVAKLIVKLRTAVLATGEPTAICVHRPVLPHILDALDIAPATLVTGEFLVAHLTSDGEVHALERHRPQRLRASCWPKISAEIDHWETRLNTGETVHQLPVVINACARAVCPSPEPRWRLGRS